MKVRKSVRFHYVFVDDVRGFRKFSPMALIEHQVGVGKVGSHKNSIQ